VFILCRAAASGRARAGLYDRRPFYRKDSVCLILGDNIFYGHGLSQVLEQAGQLSEGALVFGYWVKDPERYGVVTINEQGKASSIEEKPMQPQSNYAVVGLYFYDNAVVEIAGNLKPSARGELEITDVNNEYIIRDQLHVQLLSRGIAWLDTGTHESLLEASNFISTIQHRQGLMVACLEEIAYSKGFITREQLLALAQSKDKNHYGEYLFDLLK